MTICEPTIVAMNNRQMSKRKWLRQRISSMCASKRSMDDAPLPNCLKIRQPYALFALYAAMREPRSIKHCIEMRNTVEPIDHVL